MKKKKSRKKNQIMIKVIANSQIKMKKQRTYKHREETNMDCVMSIGKCNIQANQNHEHKIKK